MDMELEQLFFILKIQSSNIIKTIEKCKKQISTNPQPQSPSLSLDPQICQNRLNLSIGYKQIMLYLLSIILTAVYCQTECSENCASCTSPTSCTACLQGYMLLSSKICVPCPDYCVACQPTLTGQPLCSSCVANAQLNSSGKCFVCEPSCLTCTGTSNNCQTCKPGLLLSIVNGVRTCSLNKDCLIGNCQQCETDSSGYKYCASCAPGYFRWRDGCAKCRFPCTQCSLNNTELWNTFLSDYLLMSSASLFGTSDLSKLPLPDFFNKGDFDNMPEGYKRPWIQGFWVYKSIETSLDNVQLTPDLLTKLIVFYESIKNLPGNEIRKKTYAKTNEIVGLNLTDQQYDLNARVSASFYATCSNCLISYQLVPSINDCLTCPQFCLTCVDGACKVCQPGRYLTAGTCARCRSECYQCSILAKNCTKCSSPLSLASNTCILCAYPCQTCLSINSTSACLTCKAPYSPIAANGSCFGCQQSLCKRCLSTNTNICLECHQGSSLKDGVCNKCSQNCLACELSTLACYKCPIGYLLIENTCVICGPGCLKCSPLNKYLCLTCQDGTYLNSTTGKCLPCEQGCQMCTQWGCQSVNFGYTSLSQKIIPCRPGCKKCNNTDQDLCYSCQLSYYMSNVGICLRCGIGCQKCTTETICTRCIDTYILLSNTCKKCPTGCINCVNIGNVTSCSLCKMGYSLISADCVKGTISGCAHPASNPNMTTCEICKPGYTLSLGGKCIECPRTCTGTCLPTNVSLCLGCGDGFEYRNGACVQCPIGCSSCRNGYCDACFEGFRLVVDAGENLLCGEDCFYPCATCSASGCTSCQYGYTLQGASCVARTGCGTECPSCPRGTYKSITTLICSPCLTNCASCADPNICVDCQQGYYLNIYSKCISCPSSCKNCSSYTTCSTCSVGYVRQIQRMGTSLATTTFGQTCTPCTRCKRCSVLPDSCATCPFNYFMYGAKCMGTFQVRYQYEIDYPYAQFIVNSLSQPFQTALSAQAGIDPDTNFLQSIRQGSTILNGTISCSDYNTALSVKNRLTSTIPGYKIISSSVSIYQSDTQRKPSSNPTPTDVQSHLGLIIGVTIGGVAALVLLGLGLYYLYKRKFRNTEQGEDPRDVRATSSEKEINQQWKLHL